MKKAYIVKTGACYPHAADYYLLRSYLIRNGWEITESAPAADLLIVNTCALTKEYEDKAIECVQETAKQKKRNAQLIVTGCLPGINQKRLRRISEIEAIGAGSLEKIDTLLASRLRIRDIPYLNGFKEPAAGSAREYLLRIGWGCNGRCTYCAVKRVFGKPHSRSLSQISKEYELAYRNGYRYFTLIANDSGSYGKDTGSSLGHLLRGLCKKYKDTRFKISHILPDTLQALLSSVGQFIQTGRIACMNIPIESGSDRILRLMQRGYTVDGFKECIKKLIAHNPGLDIKTDIMVGFPSETESDFLSSLRLVEWLGRYKVDFQCLVYSPRPFTEARSMAHQIPTRVKKERIRRLERLCTVSRILRDKRSFKKLERKIIFK
jgi:MiaB/RimO family radical SAM methylthiotransferase